ncbi:hypothetical protein [Chitinibacter sp. GC72]|uniref:hypothetical protein n=1 Tax=Chitinibacter sp. GC72 TaxID=1526917 RepID=UPI0012FB28E5|nr:hypothetical protein [Chitinibacter sp. GC72]
MGAESFNFSLVPPGVEPVLRNFSDEFGSSVAFFYEGNSRRGIGEIFKARDFFDTFEKINLTRFALEKKYLFPLI